MTLLRGRSRFYVAVAILMCSPMPASGGTPGDLVRMLVQIQDEIAKADGLTGYYATVYRNEERSYWSKIPLWMQQDAGGRRVKRVLDIGCGYGTLLTLATKIYRAPGYCWDVAEHLRPAVRSTFGLAFQRGNAELDPVPWKGTFDVIVMTEVLEHFNFQPVPTLRKIGNALAPGGILFLSTPDSKEWGVDIKYYKRLSDLPIPTSGKQIVDDHIWQYSLDELRHVVQQAGFSIERLEYSGSPRHFNARLTKR
jgi:SAM-dependent methyltransferase